MPDRRRKCPPAEVQKAEQESARGQPQEPSEGLPTLSAEFAKALEMVRRAMTRIARRGSQKS